MHRGVTLVELLVVIAVAAAVSLVLGVLFRSATTDIAHVQAMIDANSSISALLGQLARDVDAAKSLPDSFAGTAAGEKLLLIDLGEEVICYRLEKDRVSRQRLEESPTRDAPRSEDPPGDAVSGRAETAWIVPAAQVRWQRWRKDGKAYAIEVQTHVRHVSRGVPQAKLANSHVYFLNALDGAGGKT